MLISGGWPGLQCVGNMSALLNKTANISKHLPVIRRVTAVATSQWLFDWLPPARWPVGTAVARCKNTQCTHKQPAIFLNASVGSVKATPRCQALSGAVRLSICASPVIWYLKFVSWTQRLTDYMLVVKGQDHLTNQAFGHDFRGHTLIITKCHTKV